MQSKYIKWVVLYIRNILQKKIIIKNVLLSMKDSKEEMADKNKGWNKNWSLPYINL